MDILSPGVFIGTWRHLYVGLFTPYTVHAPLLYLPYTLIYYSVLLTAPPPFRQIYTRRPCWGGERKERGKVYYLFVTKSVHHFGELFYTVLQHCIPIYCTVHHIPLCFNYWVIQYIYTYTFPTRYEILLCSSQYICYICIYTHLICTYT